MTKFDDTNHTKLKNFMIEENQGTYTVKNFNLIQIWYLEYNNSGQSKYVF